MDGRFYYFGMDLREVSVLNWYLKERSRSNSGSIFSSAYYIVLEGDFVKFKEFFVVVYLSSSLILEVVLQFLIIILRKAIFCTFLLIIQSFRSQKYFSIY